jgi:hypothetical protein
LSRRWSRKTNTRFLIGRRRSIGRVYAVSFSGLDLLKEEGKLMIYRAAKVDEGITTSQSSWVLTGCIEYWKGVPYYQEESIKERHSGWDVYHKEDQWHRRPEDRRVGIDQFISQIHTHFLEINAPLLYAMNTVKTAESIYPCRTPLPPSVSQLE